MLPEAISSYLEKRGVKGPWSLDLKREALLPGAVVIPSFAESDNLPSLLESLSSDESLAASGLAVIFVINNRLDATTAEKADNSRSISFLEEVRGGLSFPVGIIDGSSPGRELPLKDGGVGLARKLGHDLILPRLDYSSGDPVIISLDADTLVGPGYAGAIMDHFRSASAGGAVIPFEHRPAGGEREQQAIERYELFLHSYVAGLAFAGSPYGFHTVGSAMACRASAYIRCGGMNRRRAGEDFYFLQSLAKTSGIEQVRGAVVYPSPRRSDRVPFGTGRAMGMLLDGDPEAVLFYRPGCYLILKAWLEVAMDACLRRDVDLIGKGGGISANLAEFLREQQFAAAWEGFLRQRSTPDGMKQAFHCWFDAFRTMKLFHFLAEREFPRAHPEEILAAFPDAWGDSGFSLRDRLNLFRHKNR